MLALHGDAEAAGATLALRSPVQRRQRVRTTASSSRSAARADAPARALRGQQRRACTRAAGAALRRLSAEHVPPPTAPRATTSPGRALAVFAPDLSGARAAGLGVHLTLDLAGQARFGPDVGMGRDDRLSSRPARRRAFLPRRSALLAGAARRRAAARLLRHTAQDQRPGRAGERLPDRRAAVHGVPGLVNLFGIESPGLTASLAIGDYVADLLRDPVAMPLGAPG